MCGAFWFTCMARGGNGSNAKQYMLINAFRNYTASDYYFSSICNFLCSYGTCNHLVWGFLLLLGCGALENVYFLHLLMDSLHLRFCLWEGLMGQMSHQRPVLPLSVFSHAFYFLFVFFCSVAFLSVPNMKTRFPATVRFGSKRSREQ